MRAFWLSFAAAFTLGALVAGTATAVKFAGHREAVAVGWKLIPVLVATADLGSGTRLDLSHVRTLELPEKFVSDSNVIADDRWLVLNQQIEEQVLAGNPLVWSMFVRAEGVALNDCLEAVGPQAASAGTSAAEAAAAEFAEQRRSISPSTIPTPPAQAGSIAVVAVTRDVEAGELIPLSALRTVALPDGLFTLSYVPSAQLRTVAGARAILPLVEGDPVLWQMIDDPRRPQSLTACRAAAARAESKARAASARTLAHEHFAKAAQ